MWKADIKAAFRRIPIKKAHTWAAAVVFKAAGKASIFVKLVSQSVTVVCLPGMGVDSQSVPIWGFVLGAWLGEARQADHHTGTTSSLFTSAEVC